MARRIPDPPSSIQDPAVLGYLQELVNIINLSFRENDSNESPDIFIPYGSFDATSSSKTIGNRAVVLADASASAVSLVLLDPLKTKGKFFYVKKTDTNAANDVIISVVSGGTIDAVTSVVLSVGGPSKVLFSNGTEYKEF